MPVRQPQPPQMQPNERPSAPSPMPSSPRHPVSSDQMAPRSREGTWVRSETLRVMGIDPGWAKMGIVILEQTLGGPIVCKTAIFAQTKKDKDLKKKHLRVSADDSRRLKEIWEAMDNAAAGVGGINGIAAEVYAPFKAQGGNSWKSAMAYALVHGYGMAKNIIVQPFIPQDLKRAFGLTLSASKDEIGCAVQTRVHGLTVALEKYAEGNHEHVTDAAGHAFLGLLEIYKLRQQMGVTL